LGKFIEAEIELTKAVVADSVFLMALYARGMVNDLMGHDEEAKRDFDKSLDNNPKDVDALCNRGVYCLERFGIRARVHRGFILCGWMRMGKNMSRKWYY
jgi:tetratricopeptide (TPR) repeat protein